MVGLRSAGAASSRDVEPKVVTSKDPAVGDESKPKPPVGGAGLTWGQLRYLAKEGQVCKEIRYIFVGKDFSSRKGFEDDILKALELSRPNLILRFVKSIMEHNEGDATDSLSALTEIRNELDGTAFVKYAASSKGAQGVSGSGGSAEEYGRKVLGQKVDIMLRSLSETCAAVGAWMMPDFPYGYNGVAQWVCKGLAPGCTCLNVCTLNEEIAKASYMTNACDSAKIKERAAPLGFPLVGTAEVEFNNIYRPLEDATHHLIFECQSDENAFKRELFAAVPTGFVMLGSRASGSGMDACIETIRNSLPAIVLEHTGAKATSVIDMVRLLRSNGDASTLTENVCRMAVDTWPNGSIHALTDHVMIVDVLRQSPAEIESGLARALSSIYEFVPDLGMRSKEHQSLRYSWGLLAVMQTNAASSLRFAVVMRYTIVLLTFASIAITSVYACIDEKPHPLFCLTVVLPLLLAVLITIETQHNPMSRSTAFDMAAKRLESEIYCFRCRVGKYRPLLSSGRARGSERIRKFFTDSLQDVLRELEPAMGVDHMTDFVDTPEEFPSNVLTAQQDMYGLRGSRGPARLLDWSMRSKVGLVEDAPYQPLAEVLVASEENAADAKADDDGYSVVSADTYLQRRLLVQVNSASEKAARMSCVHHTMTVLILLITTGSAAFAGFHLQYWVPVVLGLGNMFKNIVEFHSHAARVKASNAFIMELHSVYCWWGSLTGFEQRMPMSKERLVHMTEHAILAESGKVASSLRSVERERSRQKHAEEEKAGAG